MSKKNLSYKEAIEEIEKNIAAIETEKVDIDELLNKVKEVTSLITYCKSKLYKAETELGTIINKQNND